MNVSPLAAEMVREAEGAVRLRAGPPTTHNAFDITLMRGSAQTLRYELRPDGATAQAFEIPIDQLATAPYSATLRGDAGQLVVHRLKSDQLRLRLGRDDLILAPGETLPLQIEANLVGVEPLTPLDLTIEVRQGRAGQVVSSETRRLEAPVAGPVTLATQLAPPGEEGVYSVRVAALRPPGLTARFLPRSTGRVLVERRFQIGVFDTGRRRRLRTPGEPLAEIDPAAPRWWERVPRWVWPRRLPRPDQQVGSSPVDVVDGPGGRKLVRLSAGKTPRGGAWQAFPLPVGGAGLPHVVEVEYPTDQPQTLTLSVWDRDAAGRVTPLGAGESVAVDGWTPGDAERPTRTVRRLFWPRSGEPTLLLSNHQAAPARFGLIRVYQLQRNAERSAAEPPADGPLVALCLTAPRLADAVGASLTPAPEGGVIVDDLQTWFEASHRLADAVELSGYNGAVVTVASDQGAVYSSRYFAAAPGIDRAPLASSATDLPRKDLLNLLLREFDRRGLRLLPVLAFDAALVGRRVAEGGLAADKPIYPLLEESTHQAIRDATRELVSRCRDHPSFAGVAVDLGAGGGAGYAVCPADPTPTNEQVDRFLAASGLVWPAGVPRNSEAARVAVQGPWREPWNDWRMARVADNYRRLAEVVRGSGDDHQVLLLAHQLARHPAFRGGLTPSLEVEPRLAELMRGVGLDRGRLLASGAALLATHEVVGGRQISAEAIGRTINDLTATGGGPDAGPPGVFVSRVPVAHRLAPPPSNDRLPSPLPPLVCVNTPSDAGSLYTRPLIEGASGGCLLDGGRGVSLLMDDDAIALRRQIAVRPFNGEPFDEAIVARTPLHVRRRSADSATQLEIVNPLPWPVEATLTVRASEACRGRWTGGPAFGLAPGQHALTRRLPPHGFSAARFRGPPVEVLGVRSTVDSSARQALADRLLDLKRRDLNQTSRYDAAENLSFEEQDERRQPRGWRARAERGTVRSTNQSPKQGDAALLIDLEPHPDALVTLSTKPLPAPDTGQIAVTFHLRPEKLGADTRVAVRIEEVEGPYASSTTLDVERLKGTSADGPGGASAEGGWLRPFAFTASDLPIGSANPIRVVFEFRGSGRIAIDDVALHDLIFPLDLGAPSTRQKLALLKIIGQAESALASDDLDACFRVLEGYWPRFLLAHTPRLPAIEPSPAIEAAPDLPAAETPPAPAEVGSGWRGYLPRFWR